MDDKDRKLRGKLEGLFSDLPAAPQPEPASSAPPAEAPRASSVPPAGEPSAVFRAVIEHTTDGIAVSDLGGRLIYCNHTCYALFGYDEARQELANLPADMLWPNEQKHRLTNEILPQAMAGRKAWHGEVMQRRKDGSFFSAALTLFAIRDAQGQPIGRATIVRDITERHTTVETTHKQLQQQYQLMLDSADEGILGLNREEKHIFVNPAAAKMLGYPIEELVGQHSHSLWHHTRADGSPYPAEECPVHGTCATGASRQVDNEIFWRKDGTSFPVEYATTPTREGGRLTGAVVTFRDVTERKRIKDTLQQNQVALQETSAQLRTLLEYAPEAIVVIDTDAGKFTDSNENAVRLYGLSREELLKVGPADTSPPTQPDGRPSLKAFMEIMQQVLKSGTLVVEWMHRNSAGQDILCEARLVRMPAADRNLVCARITDITAGRQAELERERLLQDIQARAQRDQLINAMVARVRASLTVEQVLAATVEEIGAALGAARVAVRLDLAGGQRRGNEAR